LAIPPVEVTGVDPYNIPKSMTREQLEYWILFGIAVANKPAAITETKMKAFLEEANQKLRFSPHMPPFTVVRLLRDNNLLADYVKKHRFGQYGRITGAFGAVVDLDLDRITVEALEAIKGIGPKTARMIMLYYDPTANCVPLDTHVLKYLKSKGYDAPKATPSAGKKYRELEQAFVNEALKAGKTVRELDTEVWLFYAKK
jgi:hypothetical protein